jgi:hypothetical protein
MLTVDGYELEKYVFDPYKIAVRSLTNGKYLKPFKRADGEHVVVVRVNRKAKSFRMSHIVYSEMMGINVERRVVRYRNSNPDDLNIENLYIAC